MEAACISTPFTNGLHRSVSAPIMKGVDPTKIDNCPAFREQIVKNISTGNLVEGSVVFDSTLDGHDLHQFKGLVYRSESEFRPSILENGFESKNDISTPENYRESTGIGIKDGNSDSGVGVGATGQSGVSTAKEYDKCKSYGNIHYVVDTRLLPPSEKAFDMENNTKSNKLTYDDSSEVNITRIPSYAIVGVFEGDAPRGIMSLPAYYSTIMFDEEEGKEIKKTMIKNYSVDHDGI
ncbi:hypothetical protein ABH905_005254 [Pseudomonas frederiksbergensis]|uniref:hypothetical protein n=1 Tax=Pseudomonas frederiksbergensis TaxID=104087 RepID=UPI003D23C7B5